MTSIRRSTLAAVCAAVALPAALRAQDAPRATPIDVMSAGDPAPALLHACYIPQSGTTYRIKVIGAPDKCAKNHVEFSWNQQGVQGPAGSVGAQGPAGPQGPTGPQGPAGPAGEGSAFALPYAGAATSALNTSLFKVTQQGAGVSGEFVSTGSGTALRGSSLLGAGVQGLSSIVGATSAGVRAEHVSQSGTALEITKGGIRVTGAGMNTPTTAFRMEVSCIAKYIDNPLSNNRPDALVFVTVVGITPVGYATTAYVEYDHAAGKWMVKANIPNDGPFCAAQRANVLIVTP